jgi:hypothetical protein
MKRMHVAILLVIAALCLAFPASAQQATADLRGIVTDQTSAAIGEATISLVNTGTQMSRTMKTLQNGAYSFGAVPAGNYTLTVEKQGFKGKRLEGVVLTVGQTASLDVVMEVGTVQQLVTVTGAAPLMATQDSMIGSTIEEETIRDLPLQGRQFANLAALTPGVTLQYNADPTAANRLMPSIAGGRGRFTSFYIDNADDNEDMDGGMLQSASLEAVQEFQVVTHRFTAEQGRAGYGIINVITKSGTNTFHGSAFEFFRNDHLNWRTHTEELNDEPKSSYNRNQYGGSVGGPIVKDRLFFFASVERLAQTTVNDVNTLGIAPQLDGPESLPQTNFMTNGKLDVKLTPNHLLSVRYSREHNVDESGAGTTIPKEAQGTNQNYYNAGVINLTSTLGPTKINQLTFEVATWENLLPPNSVGPGLYFPNGVILGEGGSFPQDSDLKKYQLRDTFSVMTGKHNIKFGVEEVLTPHTSGSYTTQTNPQYVFLGNSMISPVEQIYSYTGLGVYEFNTFNRFGAFAQDDWQVSRKLTLNLGLRWDYYGGVAFNQSYSQTYDFLQTVLPSFARKQTPTPLTNFGPRVGFAYDVAGNGNTVIRGGYGLYYNFPIETSIFTIFDRNPNPLRLGYFVSDPNGIKNPDGSFYQYGQPLPPNQITSSPIGYQDSVVDPNSTDPRYQHASIGVERRLTPNTMIEADFLWSRGDHTAFANSINRYPGPGEPRPYAADGLDFPIRIEQTIGKNKYKALNISITHHYSRHFAVTAWYSYSKCRATNVRAADEGFSSYPMDENHPLSPQYYGPCGLSPDNVVTISPIWTLPKQFQISSMTRFTSGLRYNITAGVDLNGDGVINDLPPGVPYINDGIGANFFQMDLRLSKFFKLRERGKIEGMFEIYNIFNNTNPALYSGNELANNFGQPTAFAGDPRQGEMRLIQVGVRFTF